MKESVNMIKKLNESYDMYNVFFDVINDLENLQGKLNKGEIKDINEVSRLLGIIIENTKRNYDDAE